MEFVDNNFNNCYLFYLERFGKCREKECYPYSNRTINNRIDKMKNKYRHRFEHDFGLDTEGLLRDELNEYSERISEISRESNLPKNYVRRAITYLTFKHLRRGRDANLEKSVNIVERWLRRGGGKWKQKQKSQKRILKY